jgi:uncharacterized protein
VKVLISGSSGLVGTASIPALQSAGHQVVRLLRQAPGGSHADAAWNPESGEIELSKLERIDAVVHLAGAPIADKRWTPARKQLLRSSRVEATRNLVASLSRLKQKPSVFISASAVGYYGDRGDELLTESSPPGSGFISDLARDWEAEALTAGQLGMRVVLLRIGVVLSGKGGALARMLPPFRLGVGGRLSSGKMWMSWVALVDVVSIIGEAIERRDWQGPINVASPNPVMNEDFTQALARLLRRPAIFPVPPFALRLLFGELADSLLLGSARQVPEKLNAYQYKFRFPELEPALRACVTGSM